MSKIALNPVASGFVDELRPMLIMQPIQQRTARGMTGNNIYAILF